MFQLRILGQEINDNSFTIEERLIHTCDVIQRWPLTWSDATFLTNVRGLTWHGDWPLQVKNMNSTRSRFLFFENKSSGRFSIPGPIRVKFLKAGRSSKTPDCKPTVSLESVLPKSMLIRFSEFSEVRLANRGAFNSRILSPLIFSSLIFLWFCRSLFGKLVKSFSRRWNASSFGSGTRTS